MQTQTLDPLIGGYLKAARTAEFTWRHVSYKWNMALTETEKEATNCLS